MTNLNLNADDVILPEGWDGESDILDQTPATEDPTIDQDAVEKPDEELVPAEGPDLLAEEEVETPTTETTETVKNKVKVKFNHEELELDEDEAATWAQLGMNSKKAIAQATAKAEDLEKQLVEYDKFAKVLNYQSTSEMMEAAKVNYFNERVESLVNDGVHQAIAEDLVRRSMVDEAKNTVVLPDPQVLAAEAETKMRDKDLDDFVARYPGITKLPPEVLVEYEAKGKVGLTAIYADYKTREAQKELQVLKQNQLAAAKAPVGGATKHGSTNAKADDPFSAGFNSDPW